MDVKKPQISKSGKRVLLGERSMKPKDAIHLGERLIKLGIMAERDRIKIVKGVDEDEQRDNWTAGRIIQQLTDLAWVLESLMTNELLLADKIEDDLMEELRGVL